MKTKLNIVPEGDNVCVYFIMPLIGLNKASFGGKNNFYNAYMSYGGKLIAVIKDKNETNYINHPNYLTDFDVDIDEERKGTAVVYSIPTKFDDDVNCFLEGRYSEMSEQSKDLIKKGSGLPYKIPIEGKSQTNTHKLLYVLDASEVLKNWMEKELKVEIKGELLDKPHYDREFMDIDTVVI